MKNRLVLSVMILLGNTVFSMQSFANPEDCCGNTGSGGTLNETQQKPIYKEIINDLSQLKFYLREKELFIGVYLDMIHLTQRARYLENFTLNQNLQLSDDTIFAYDFEQIELHTILDISGRGGNDDQFHGTFSVICCDLIYPPVKPYRREEPHSNVPLKAHKISDKC